MFKTVNHPLRHWGLLLLSGLLAMSQPLYADVSFRIDPIQESTLPRYKAANVGSWEEFKRIRQDGGTATDTVPDNAGSKNEALSTKKDATSMKQAQQTSVPKTPSVQQTAPHVNAIVHKPAVGKPAPEQITAPVAPTEKGGWWVFYAGVMAIHDNPYYDPHGIDFKWAYSHKNPLPKDPRIVVFMHGSGGGEGVMQVFGPSAKGDIEVRTQDAEAYNQDWREWWTFGRDGTPYPGRRITATVDFLVDRYGIDTSSRGIGLEGPSMGGAGAVIQTMILPDPWRSRIAYSSARAGVIMPRLIAKRDPAQYATFSPDNESNRVLWDSIDFSIQAAVDPIVRGIHYRHAFSSDDQFSADLDGNTQLDFVNLVELNKISGAFTWVKTGHGTYEEGVALSDISEFESQEQDMTLDRGHPAITNSTGNYPLLAVDRENEAQYPRGHYNMEITWARANIVDDSAQIVFPIKYNTGATCENHSECDPTATKKLFSHQWRNAQVVMG